MALQHRNVPTASQPAAHALDGGGGLSQMALGARVRAIGQVPFLAMDTALTLSIPIAAVLGVVHRPNIILSLILSPWRSKPIIAHYVPTAREPAKWTTVDRH